MSDRRLLLSRALLPAVVVASTLASSACKSGSDLGEPAPEEAPLLEAIDQTLPVGVYEEPYDHAIAASAGTEPYTWSVPEWETLPGGLSLTPDGRVEGTPSQPGTFTFQVRVADAAGREKRPYVTISVVMEPTVLACGDTLEGSFLQSAFDGADPDPDLFKRHDWFTVEIPDDLTTEVNLVWEIDGTPLVAFIEKPGEVIGSWDFEEHYVPKIIDPFDPESLETPVHAGTNPSLSGYQGVQPTIPVWAVAQGTTDYKVTVECSDGPVFVVVPQYPTMLGEPLDYDFEVYGDPGDTTRIYTEDELPEWMEWDETTGRITGTAEEAGSWPFTVIAESADGRVREERSIIGVYPVTDIGCDETLTGSTTEAYFDGEFTTYYDTNGYQMYRMVLPTDTDVSSVTLTLDDLDSALLGTAEPDIGYLRFYPGAERIYTSFYPAEFTLGPRAYPALRHYRDSENQELFILAAPTGLDYEFSLSTACNREPVPDFAGLPVVPLFEEMDHVLNGSGGNPAYGWSIDGLPPGLDVSVDGRLTGSSGDAGAYDTTVTITDKDANTTDDSFPLYVGYDAACEGETMVACGDTVEGTFELSYLSDGDYSERSTARLCLVQDFAGAVGFTVESFDTQLRVDIADPGRTVDEMFYDEKGTYVLFVDRWDVEGLGINPYSFPNLLDYRFLPIHVTVRAFDDGDWKATVTCE